MGDCASLQSIASGFFLRAPTHLPEAGGPTCAGPSAAWMPPRSLQGRIHGVSRTGRATGFPHGSFRT
ncbi:hypothetical protein D0Y53_06120 [Luteimonas weifangensis]|uniref:Uncharacterized protein n=1 Tax=Cognatiluteimonas weifangensis TaxID=2303539 RepID=A0A372DMF2_9GAMM|nr:hypothetical protein D0Y53_06120 [Luteimonas weifangensis]